MGIYRPNKECLCFFTNEISLKSVQQFIYSASCERLIASGWTDVKIKMWTDMFLLAFVPNYCGAEDKSSITSLKYASRSLREIESSIEFSPSSNESAIASRLSSKN